MSLAEIIDETKVSRRILEALESGRYQYLPESVFSRNFVRQYARCIGCDEERLVDAFEAAWEHFRLSSGSHPVVVAVEPPPKRPIRWEYWIPIVIAGGLLVAALLAVLGGSSPTQEDELGAIVGAARRTTPTGSPFTPTPFEQEATAEAGVELAEPPGQPATVVIRVAEERECWVHYRDHEGHTGQRLLAGGEELSLTLSTPALISLGNAAAVRIELGSRIYENLGRPGQVIHCEVGPEGLVELGRKPGHE